MGAGMGVTVNALNYNPAVRDLMNSVLAQLHAALLTGKRSRRRGKSEPWSPGKPGCQTIYPLTSLWR
jgi:hypothetical protein